MSDKAEQDNGRILAERLREFLRTLAPTTCAQLLDTIEKAGLSGEPVKGSDMIAEELRAILREHAAKRPRTGTPTRFFFRSIEALLIDEELPEKRRARIERKSLSFIWQWIQRNLLPDETKAYDEACAAAMLIGDIEAAKTLSNEFQRLVAIAVRKAIDENKSEQDSRRLVSQVGGAQVFEDLKDMMVILENRDAFRALSERVLGPIRNVDDQQATFLATSLMPFARSSNVLTPYAGAFVMSKMSQPWQIVRVVTVCCETDSADKIADSAFGAIIELALTDVERMVIRAANARRNLDVAKVLAAARDFSGFVRALTTDINLAAEPGWARRLGIHRGKMGELLRTQIETLPGRVRWLLKPPGGPNAKKAEQAAGEETESIESALDILLLAKTHAAEFALNEVTMRVFGDLQTMLDSGLNPLIEGMRQASGPDRDRRLRQLDTGIRIASKIFGASYAALIQKAVDVAAAGDKKGGKAA